MQRWQSMTSIQALRELKTGIDRAGDAADDWLNL
jgi:hypothetical protein